MSRSAASAAYLAFARKVRWVGVAGVRGAGKGDRAYPSPWSVPPTAAAMASAVRTREPSPPMSRDAETESATRYGLGRVTPEGAGVVALGRGAGAAAVVPLSLLSTRSVTLRLLSTATIGEP
jgi:hypothetical protein